ncbi:MAG: ribonuclease J [Candidatus Sericytochromatia bacterium]|nr:ribonuclease J [Candidatus Sericytochromatia bacterium]
MSENFRHPSPIAGAVQVIPLGGLGEIGKNTWCLRVGDDIVVFDCGFAFPNDDMPGIDYVLPDYAYLESHADLVRGIFISHGHEDHIGGLPFLLERLPVPVYATPLTLSLIEGKLSEHGLLGRVQLCRVEAGAHVRAGHLDVQLIRVAHSIPDAVAIAVDTPLGVVLYSGDFKFDPTPIDGQRTDYHALTSLGERGCFLLMSDSTNATRPGFTASEAAVGPALDRVFAQTSGRLIITTFASNIHRVQQVFDAAKRYGRRVALLGRSMVNVSERARALGYLTWQHEQFVALDALDSVPPEELVVLTTGSQGEPMAGLSRLATGEQKGLQIQHGDTVLISAIPIPGNEKAVARVINQLYERGAQVVYDSPRLGTHVSGHASEEELKLMLAFTRPRHFVPIHGELRHLTRHAELAMASGVSPQGVYILRNGDVLELREDAGCVVAQVPVGPVLVDGRLRFTRGQSQLRERQRLAHDGVVATLITVDAELVLRDGPDILTRGFIPPDDVGMRLLDEAKRRIVEVVDEAHARKNYDLSRLERQVVEATSRFFYETTGQRPAQMVFIKRID